MFRSSAKKFIFIANLWCFIRNAEAQQPLYAQNPQSWQLTFPGLPGSEKRGPAAWGPQTPNASPLLSISSNVSKSDNTSFNALPSLEGLQTPNSTPNGFSLRIPANGTGNCQNGTFAFGVQQPNCVLTLGPNSQLLPSADGSTWPTLPFSMNLGNSSSRQGFIGFGGAFDADAVGSDQWILIPETAAPGSTFLQTGRQVVSSAQLLDFQYATVKGNYKIVLDFNADSLQYGGFGDDLLCAEPIGVRFTQSAGVTSSGRNTDVMMGWNITTAVQSQYYDCIDTADPSMVVLGKPFFQAVVMYVNETGAVYLTQARQQTGIPDWQIFNARNLTLKNAVAPVPSAKSSATKVAAGWKPWSVAAARLTVLVNTLFFLM